MWSRKQAMKEIEIAVLKAAEHNGGKLSRDWAIQYLMTEHATEIPNHDSFAFFATREWVAHAVREYSNKLDRPFANMPEQMRLDFPNLKPAYAVERDGVLVSIPVWQLDPSEMRAKAALYRANATSLMAEADDLDRLAETMEADIQQ